MGDRLAASCEPYGAELPPGRSPAWKAEHKPPCNAPSCEFMLLPASPATSISQTAVTRSAVPAPSPAARQEGSGAGGDPILKADAWGTQGAGSSCVPPAQSLLLLKEPSPAQPPPSIPVLLLHGAGGELQPSAAVLWGCVTAQRCRMRHRAAATRPYHSSREGGEWRDDGCRDGWRDGGVDAGRDAGIEGRMHGEMEGYMHSHGNTVAAPQRTQGAAPSNGVPTHSPAPMPVPPALVPCWSRKRKKKINPSTTTTPPRTAAKSQELHNNCLQSRGSGRRPGEHHSTHTPPQAPQRVPSRTTPAPKPRASAGGSPRGMGAAPCRDAGGNTGG